MWDETLIRRVKERKSAELMLCAAMVRMEPEKRGIFLDVISKLGTQLDACDAILGGATESPEAERIVTPEYRDRLTPVELEDEDVFNTCIVHPINPNDSNLSAYILDLMDRAQAVRDGNAVKASCDEAISSMKDELRSCRSRIEMLTEQLDLAQSEIAVVTEERDEISEELDKARSAPKAGPAAPVLPDFSWVDEELAPITAALDSVVETDGESAGFYMEKLNQARQDLLDITAHMKQEMSAAGLSGVEEQLSKVYVAQASVQNIILLLNSGKSEEPSAEVTQETSEEAPAAAEEPVEKPVYDTILTPDELQMLTVIDMMKNSKIDFFVDMSMSRRFNENACEDVITFLKVDLGIIRALLSMDYTSKESIEENFLKILDILETAPEPKHQKMYVNSLSAKERIVEDTYNRIIAKVQDVMLLRYRYLTE